MKYLLLVAVIGCAGEGLCYGVPCNQSVLDYTEDEIALICDELYASIPRERWDAYICPDERIGPIGNPETCRARFRMSSTLAPTCSRTHGEDTACLDLYFGLSCERYLAEQPFPECQLPADCL